MTDLHRQTIVGKLSQVPLAPGSNPKLKLYSVIDILTPITDPSQQNIDGYLPQDRKAWYQSEREWLKFELETSRLIPAEDC